MNVHPAPPRKQGPLVFLDMDQQALDDAYDQEIYAPNRALVVERRHAASERARRILGNPRRLAYGPSEHEGLDVFDCGVNGAPVNVFVHGGAWRRNKAADYVLQGETLVRAGAHSALLDFFMWIRLAAISFPCMTQGAARLAFLWGKAKKIRWESRRALNFLPFFRLAIWPRSC